MPSKLINKMKTNFIIKDYVIAISFHVFKAIAMLNDVVILAIVIIIVIKDAVTTINSCY